MKKVLAALRPGLSYSEWEKAYGGKAETFKSTVRRLRERVEFQAYSRGYFGPLASEPATSWAAPHLTGLAARLLSLRPGLKPFEVKTLLYWMSRRSD